MADSTVIDKAKAVTITDPRTDAAAREKLTTARIGLLLKAPFFGQLATRMTLTNADEWCGTAATDGRKFYYNSEFVNKMPLKQLEFLVGHEILHAVYDHMGRRGDRMPRLSNIAADYCVNQDLVDQRIGEKISVVPILTICTKMQTRLTWTNLSKWFSTITWKMAKVMVTVTAKAKTARAVPSLVKKKHRLSVMRSRVL